MFTTAVTSRTLREIWCSSCNAFRSAQSCERSCSGAHGSRATRDRFRAWVSWRAEGVYISVPLTPSLRVHVQMNTNGVWCTHNTILLIDTYAWLENVTFDTVKRYMRAVKIKLYILLRFKAKVIRAPQIPKHWSVQWLKYYATSKHMSDIVCRTRIPHVESLQARTNA